MLMRPKRLLDRLPALNASGPDGQLHSHPAEEMPSDVVMPGAPPVTSFLFLRYRLQSLKVGADIPDQDGMIIVI